MDQDSEVILYNFMSFLGGGGRALFWAGIAWGREQPGILWGFLCESFLSFLYPLSLVWLLLLFVFLSHCSFQYIVHLSACDLQVLYLQFFSPSCCRGRRGHRVWGQSVGALNWGISVLNTNMAPFCFMLLLQYYNIESGHCSLIVSSKRPWSTAQFF